MVISALLGIEILVEDAVLGPDNGRYLWDYADVAAPVSHAYALSGFVLVDFIVAAVILARHKLGVQVALVWSILQALAMLLNPLTGPQFSSDLPPVDFALYLYGIPGFDALLLVRILTVPIAWMSLKALKTEAIKTV